MGILIGLTSALLFGLTAVFIKIGMRRRPVDNGLFMSVLVNVLFLGALMLFISLPEWSWPGVAGFVVAGLMATWIARGASFVAIRLLGPARQSAILVSAPLFAALIGWFFLGEGMTLLQAGGGVVVSVGLLVLIRSRIDSEASTPDGQGLEIGSVGSSSGLELVTTRRARIQHIFRHDDFVRGFIAACAAAMLFGASFVVRKWSFDYFPSAVAGGFFGTVTAMTMITLDAAAKGKIRRLIDDNLRDIPWWFVGAGAASTIALLLQFSAYGYLPAWIVGLLLGTQAVWAVLWAWLLLRHEELIGWELLVSIGLVVGGVAIMTYGL